MKWLWAAVPAIMLLGGVAAQEALTDRLPSCAAKCFEATLPTTSCQSDDISCLCTDPSFFTAAAGCNALNCPVVETLSATNATRAACGIPVRSQQTTMIAVTATFGALAVVMVSLRLIDRGISTAAKLGWDDLLIGLAGLSSLFQNVPVVVAGHIGFGKDIWGMTAYQITTSFKWLYVTYFMYQVAEAFCQLSILAFYLRIMTSRNGRLVVWALMTTVVCFGLGNTFSMMFQCWPLPYFWDGWKGQMAGKCTVDIRLFGFIRGGIEICLDIAILSLPLPTLYKLQMSLKKKMQIMSMFCVGFVITVVSCLRLQALVQFAQTTNPTYDNVPGVYWCVTEANLFIVVACMPAMRALLQRAIPSIGSFRDTSRKGHSGYASAEPTKGSYFGNSFADRRQKSNGSIPFGVITKSMDVKVYRSERSRSDGSDSEFELVDRNAKPAQF